MTLVAGITRHTTKDHMMPKETKDELYIRLGKIMLEEAGEEACMSGYETIDPYFVGRKLYVTRTLTWTVV